MRKIILSVLSGLLFAFSWPTLGFFPLIFIAFLPLLILEQEICSKSSNSSLQLFGFSFLSFFIFNIITTYWIWHATMFGALSAFIINSLLMSLFFVLFHKVKKILGKKKGYISFIFLWISMEYLHLNWELAWPWLTLGNVFAPIPGIVQWYEFTGVLGGSLWVLIVNLLFFGVFILKEKIRFFVYVSIFIIIPIVISIIIYPNMDLSSIDHEEIVIVQPNVDPYLDKFNLEALTQLDNFIELSKTKLTNNTSLLLGPETALQESNMWESQIDNSPSIQQLMKLQREFPNLNILIGASTYKYLGNHFEKNSRKLNSKEWYNAYNSALFLENDSTISIYHKTRLVPGVEQIPYSFLFDYIVDLTVDLGGTSGSLSTDNSINIFESKGLKLLPLICYESVFGDMITGRNFNLIAIITNDGWWKNTSGYKQHFEYARLRAIEQRTSIIRSANTGISGLILPNGDVVQNSVWDEEIVINVQVPLLNSFTFYNKYGDLIGRVFSFVSVLLIMSTIVRNRTKKILTSKDVSI